VHALFLSTFLIAAAQGPLFAPPPLSATLTSVTPSSPFLPCPVTVTFIGSIDGLAGQAVQYYFTRTVKGFVTATKPVKASLGVDGKLAVGDAMSIGAAQTGPGSDELDIVSSTVKAKATFNVACTTRSGIHPLVQLPTPGTEGSWPYEYPYPPDLSRCDGTPPDPIWQNGGAAELRGGFTAEHLYLQERYRYGFPTQIGFAPNAPLAFCVKWIVTVTHDNGMPVGTSFLITAQHIHGGPMLCISDYDGTPHVSQSGGPINTLNDCQVLPLWQHITASPSPLPPRVIR
jgi:hypothetical protein